eukprot:NODE_674_length_1522_cov_84.771894_g554_i0.p1 GENE.NODE_674_length_1522_cov_84.771894_g554_i0~~NODE_674_length_1522_cov_84.771894_g554_i0.p1  ORF type:complete len:327 (+),score=95.13 NODE_674_length_1522_cov_84.771894_g554_i0:342-1322(+)
MNGIRDLGQRPVDKLLPNLKVLNLVGNEIQNWDALGPLEALPFLSTLVLNSNAIREIPGNRSYPSLTSLSIADNPVSGLSSLAALNTFPALTTLRMSPLVEGTPSAQARMLLIPYVRALVTLNGSKITPKERSDAEKQYLKSCAAELRDQHGIGHHDDDCSALPPAFLGAHPEYPRLVCTHHNPLPHAEGPTPATTANDAVVLTMRSMCSSGIQSPDKTKRLPLTYSVAKLKVLLQSMYGLSCDRQRLVARVHTGDIPYSVDLSDDFNDLQYYCVTDGTLIEMHERDRDEERRGEEKKAQEQEARMQQQLREANAQMDLRRAHDRH